MLTFLLLVTFSDDKRLQLWCRHPSCQFLLQCRRMTVGFTMVHQLLATAITGRNIQIKETAIIYWKFIAQPCCSASWKVLLHVLSAVFGWNLRQHIVTRVARRGKKRGSTDCTKWCSCYLFVISILRRVLVWGGKFSLPCTDISYKYNVSPSWHVIYKIDIPYTCFKNLDPQVFSTMMSRWTCYKQQLCISWIKCEVRYVQAPATPNSTLTTLDEQISWSCM